MITDKYILLILAFDDCLRVESRKESNTVSFPALFTDLSFFEVIRPIRMIRGLMKDALPMVIGPPSKEISCIHEYQTGIWINSQELRVLWKIIYGSAVAPVDDLQSRGTILEEQRQCAQVDMSGVSVRMS